MVHAKINQSGGISCGFFQGRGQQKINLHLFATPLKVQLGGRGWWGSWAELFSPGAINRKNMRSVSQGPSQSSGPSWSMTALDPWKFPLGAEYFTNSFSLEMIFYFANNYSI